MMKKNNTVFQGVYSLFVLVVFFLLHDYLNHLYQWVDQNLIFKIYVVLSSLTVLFFILFAVAKKNVPDHLGFLYLFLVMIKFTLLFILFYSEVNNDLATKRAEVLTLLFPYLVSVFLSAFPLSKELNKS
jgi:hypothetical protein